MKKRIKKKKIMQKFYDILRRIKTASNEDDIIIALLDYRAIRPQILNLYPTKLVKIDNDSFHLLPTKNIMKIQTVISRLAYVLSNKFCLNREDAVYCRIDMEQSDAFRFDPLYYSKNKGYIAFTPLENKTRDEEKLSSQLIRSGILRVANIEDCGAQILEEPCRSLMLGYPKCMKCLAHQINGSIDQRDKYHFEMVYISKDDESKLFDDPDEFKTRSFCTTEQYQLEELFVRFRRIADIEYKNFLDTNNSAYKPINSVYKPLENVNNIHKRSLYPYKFTITGGESKPKVPAICPLERLSYDSCNYEPVNYKKENKNG